MAMISKLLTGCCLRPDDDHEQPPAEKEPLLGRAADPSNARLADDIVAKLAAAESAAALRADLRSAAHACGWREGLAEAVFEALKRAVELGTEMGPLMKEAYDKVVAAVNNVEEWAEAHPVTTTLIVLGLLAVMVPWVLTALGFAEGGILEGTCTSFCCMSWRVYKVLGSWAALWQATYRGYVPKGSLFSFFQSLGTRIGMGA
jgi:hypothetical protein